jgi:hypothetical protein
MTTPGRFLTLSNCLYWRLMQFRDGYATPVIRATSTSAESWCTEPPGSASPVILYTGNIENVNIQHPGSVAILLQRSGGETSPGVTGPLCAHFLKARCNRHQPQAGYTTATDPLVVIYAALSALAGDSMHVVKPYTLTPTVHRTPIDQRHAFRNVQ